LIDTGALVGGGIDVISLLAAVSECACPQTATAAAPHTPYPGTAIPCQRYDRLQPCVLYCANWLVPRSAGGEGASCWPHTTRYHSHWKPEHEALLVHRGFTGGASFGSRDNHNVITTALAARRHGHMGGCGNEETWPPMSGCGTPVSIHAMHKGQLLVHKCLMMGAMPISPPLNTAEHSPPLNTAEQKGVINILTFDTPDKGKRRMHNADQVPVNVLSQIGFAQKKVTILKAVVHCATARST
jgi:hypothetical protein